MSDFNIEFEENDQQIKLEFESGVGGAVSSVNGMTGDVVLDADDVGAYTKPTGGIPKTDLASAVQTSLGKADTAYQKPSGGIPANDIASGVVPAVDNTLAVSGAAADAKKVGDEISTVKDGLSSVSDNVTELDYFVRGEVSYTVDTALEYYPIPTYVGDVVTVKSKSGDNFVSAWGLLFYASDKTTRTGTYTFTATQSERTFPIENAGAYIRPNSSLAETVIVTISRGISADSRITKNADDISEINKEIYNLPAPLNLFDSTALIPNKYINSSTGEVSNYTGYNCTDYIPIKKGVTYYISAMANNLAALYNADKTYYSAPSVVIDTDCNKLWHFTAPIDGWFRGTLTSLVFVTKCYFSPYYNVFTPYTGTLDYSVSSDINSNLIADKAIGGTSGNLFTGGSNNFEFNSNTGACNLSLERVMTPKIAISGYVFWYVNDSTSDLVKYVLEYDTNGNFIKYSTVSGKQIGYLALDANTAYIRINSKTFSPSDLIAPQQYDKILYVTDSFTKLGKFISTQKATDPSSTVIDFYDHAVSFHHNYVLPAIKPYAESINMGGYDFVMPMMTDIHTIDSEAYKMLAYMAETGVADVCFNLGDNIPDHFEDGDLAVDFLNAVELWGNSPFAKCALYALRGNHDNNPVSDDDADTMVSNAEYYNINHSRTKKGYAGTNKNYGYVDFEQPKIRVIFLDSGDIYDNNGEALTSGYNVMVQQEQFDWFCNTALDFSGKSNASEWSVITVSHAQIAAQLSTAFTAVLQAFMDGSSASGTASTSYGDYTNTLTYNVDYTSQGSVEYICHVNGHTHDDADHLIGNTGRYDIDIACDNGTAYYYVGSTRTAYTRTVGTIEEHLMDTLCLDKTNHKIYMKRLGVGEDREYSY